jgi:hypothetical protein
VIDHLVKRFNHKDGSSRKVRKTPKKGGKSKKNGLVDDENELSELSDVGSDEE